VHLRWILQAELAVLGARDQAEHPVGAPVPEPVNLNEAPVRGGY
jgi:hypothetical protein